MNSFPAAQFVVSAVFALFVAMTVSGALIAAFSTRIIRSVCGLAICCLGLAGLYYFLHSPFLALMEVLIYVGAVCVTIIFAIMLAEPEESRRPQPRQGAWAWIGSAWLASILVFASLAWLGTQHPWAPAPTRLNTGSVADIGVSLLTTYSLAFELISLVLLVAIVGALAIARTGRTRP